MAAPELYPAVDILAGRAVRLVQGDFRKSTDYVDDPLEAARTWVESGARRLHVVDLDGAREGRPVHIEQLRRITRELDVPVQYGGGLRSVEAARQALDAGARRVVLGTIAFTNVSVLDALLRSDGPSIAVAVDARDRKVATGGWTETTELDPADAVGRLRDRGVTCVVFTNVDVDGTLAGIDERLLVQVSEARGKGALVYSGGIGTLDHLRGIAALELPNLEGVIVGKALYERRFSVTDALTALGHGP